MTLEKVLRSYWSIQGHQTRCKKEKANLLQLLIARYSSMSEERINDRLEKLEKYTNKLSDITEYLVTLKYTKARDYQEEVKEFSDVLDKCSADIFTVLHNRHLLLVLLPTLLNLLSFVLSLSPLCLSFNLRSSGMTLSRPSFGLGRNSSKPTSTLHK